jgi:hypothetical protein
LPGTFVGLLQIWNDNLRLQYFTTGCFSTRICAYESDVLDSFSIPSFFDSSLPFGCGPHKQFITVKIQLAPNWRKFKAAGKPG